MYCFNRIGILLFTNEMTLSLGQRIWYISNDWAARL